MSSSSVDAEILGKRTDYLKNIAFFTGLKEEYLKIIAQDLNSRKYKKMEIIFHPLLLPLEMPSSSHHNHLLFQPSLPFILPPKIYHSLVVTSVYKPFDLRFFAQRLNHQKFIPSQS